MDVFKDAVDRISRREVDLIIEIAKRAETAASGLRHGYDRLSMQMDLILCHRSCPLWLDAMATGRDLDVLHDVFGIGRHLDRDTGELRDCFMPRFAAPTKVEG